MKMQKGKTGEIIACDFLKEKGYIILHTNWRSKPYEVDIIALEKDCLVFVEVKTRSSNDFGLPQDFVDTKKQANLINAAQIFINNSELNFEIRFDVVAIIIKDNNVKIEHISHAFDPLIGM